MAYKDDKICLSSRFLLFYPISNIYISAGLSGDIHFDDAEKYTILDLPRSSGTIKLLWVAVHELGHSLGLSHSDLRGAVMYPWYLHFPGLDFNLTTDDMLGIRAVYGKLVGSGFLRGRSLW